MLEQIVSSSGYTLFPGAIPILATAVCCFIISLIGAIREGPRLGQTFLVLGGTVVIWFVSSFFLYCSTNERTALWWAKAIYLGVPFMPAALYHFTVKSLNSETSHKRMILAGWVVSTLFSAAIVATNLFIVGVRPYWWGYRPRFSPLTVVYLVYFVGFLGLSVYHLYRDYETAERGSIHRKRTRLLLIAFGISSAGFVDYLPNLGIPLYPFGYLAVLISSVLVAVAMWRYRLSDITPQFAAQKIIDTMHDSLLVLDAFGIIRLVNKSTTTLLGYSEGELLGRHISETFGNGSFAELVGRDSVRNIELSYSHPNGGIRILDLSGSLMHDEHDRSLAYVFIARDVTHIKHTESELIKARDELELRVEERSSDLRKANEQLRQEKTFSDTIIDSLPGVFYLCDEEGRLVRWHNNDEGKSDYSPQELSGMNVRQLFQKDRELVAGKIQEVFKNGQAAMQASLVTKGGSLIPFYLTGFRMAINDKRYIVGVGINISESKRLEWQLLQAQKMEAIGVLAGGIAHDFNNMLTAIMGYASLLRMKVEHDDTLLQHVEQILSATEKAAALTQSLLAFSRKRVIDLKTVNINDIISGFHKILARLIGEDIEFKLALTPERMLVKVDKGQFEQVLMNLATNARDAMPQGGRLCITTEVAVLDADNAEIKKGSYAAISVSDTGTGMDRATLKHVFEPFFTTKEVGKGTGLGLAIVYGVIKKHDGVIRVYSEPGTGTTFKIYLPLSPFPAKENSPEKPVMPLTGTEVILLAEDDASVRRMTRTMLEEFGYTILEAVDGEDAITVFRDNQKRIQLVLCDVIMPKKNGKETSDEIRKMRPDIKIIFASGYTADILAQKGIQEGVHLISKPLSPSLLLKKIREVLES